MSEICNGFDEDCDGQIDEDFSELGMACDGDDADSCALGVYTCSPDGTGVVCTGEDLVGITEVCNGVDDDCDGDIDETGCLTIGGVPVQPYTSTSSVQDWYSYSVPAGSSANANLAIANQAIVYFHQDQNGNLSLVLTLDIPQDSSGGTTVLEINGATGMDILVSDDGGEATMNGSSGTGVGDFNWLACCTDGLVLGYWTSSSCITMDVTSATGINSWVVLSGDGTQETLPGAFNGSSLEVCGQP